MSDQAAFKALETLVLASGKVFIDDFGTFELVELKPKRVTTNGVVKLMPPRKVLRFRACKRLRTL